MRPFADVVRQLIQAMDRAGADGDALIARVFLEDLLGCRVDVVTATGLRPGRRQAIERDLVRVA